MHIKRFSLAAIVLMVLIGWYTFAYVSQQSISLDFFGLTLPKLPVALWAVAPMTLLFLGALLHMSYYSFLNSMKLRRYHKDYVTFIDAMCDAFLAKVVRNRSFRTKEFRMLGEVLQKSSLKTEGLIEVDNDKIKSILFDIEKVNSGKEVDLKKYNLKNSNPLIIQNQHNSYSMGKLENEKVLASPDRYDNTLCQRAYCDFVKTSPWYAIEKYKKFLTKDALILILKRINAKENNLDLAPEALLQLFKELHLSSADYIELSKVLAKTMNPDKRIHLFELASEQSDTAMEAYLYTLFDLQMLEKANDILQNSAENEYMLFKAYSALKECDKNFSINLFVA